MQIQVHGAQAHDFVDDVDAGEGFVAQSGQFVAVLGLAFHVVVGGEQEAAGAAGRVDDGFADFRVDALDHRFDDRARGEVLAGAGAYF